VTTPTHATPPTAVSIGGAAAPTIWLAGLQDSVRRNDTDVPYDHAQNAADLGPTVAMQGYPAGSLSCYLAPSGAFTGALAALLAWAFGPYPPTTVRGSASIFGYGDALLAHKVSGLVTTRSSLSWKCENGPGGHARLAVDVVGYNEFADGSMTAVPGTPVRPGYAGEAPLNYQAMALTWGSTPVTLDVTGVEFAVEWGIPVDQLVRGGQPYLADPRRFVARSATLTVDFVPGDVLTAANVHSLRGSSAAWTLRIGSGTGNGVQVAMARVEVPGQLPGYDGRSGRLLPFQMVGNCVAGGHGLTNAFQVSAT
jgi:hypothetical protein